MTGCNGSSRTASLLLLVLAGLWLAGCTVVPGITVEQEGEGTWLPGSSWADEWEDETDADGLNPRVVPVTAELVLAQRRLQEQTLRELPGSATVIDDYSYRIGPRDVLNVLVWDHPELSNPMGNFQDIEAMGRLVREDGTIFFPYAGVLQVAGKTTEQVRRELTEALRPFIQSPQVDVRVVAFRNQRVYITGEVAQPGVLPVNDVPMTVLDAINRAGGLTEFSDRRRAVLTRDGERREIDLLALFNDGRGNMLLRDGDVLFIPQNVHNKVFVMGEVNEQMSVLMNTGELTLAEAISEAEGLDLGTANTKAVYVIRAPGPLESALAQQEGSPVIYHLDMARAPALLLAEGFRLEPRDVVYVSSTGVVRWNRVIAQILPTVSTLFQTQLLLEAGDDD
ncbi:MAG TPA: polysaccharide export protein [Gammaproteobacteria bacterium]|nr:polysaccharide export protein [Gammaproteobacteria bacterium]